MNFKKLTIQNFMSIRSMSLDLENQGLVLIKGMNRDNPSARSNGAGKSSMIEALVYAVYGRTLRGIKGDSVVNKVSKKNMKIFLDFVDDDGSEYRIARYRKHSVNKNHSLLYRNGKDITPKSEADFNDAVANLLQADYLTFTSSLLYSSESFKFTSATDAEMKATFDTMLGLDVFTKCLEITKNKLKEVEDEVSTKQWKIDELKAKIEQLEGRIEQAEEQQEEWETTIADKIKELTSQLTELESEHKQLEADKVKAIKQEEKFTKELEKLVEKQKSAKKKLSQIEQLKSVIKELESDIKSNKREIKSLQNEIASADKNIGYQTRDKQKLVEKQESYETSKKKLDEKIGQPCPTCGQPMTVESVEPAKAEYDEKIQDCLDRIADCDKEVEKLTADKEVNQAKIDTLNEQISELEGDIESYTELIEKSQGLVDEADELDEEVGTLRDKVAEAKSNVKVLGVKITSNEDKAQSTQKQIDEAKATKNPYDATIEQYNKEQVEAQERITEYKDSIKDKLDEKECLQFWQQAYSNQGIKSFILDDITPFLNRRVNKYLKKLASNHIEVKFSTQTQLKSGEMREKFSIEIENEDGGNEYISNSSGERRRIDIAVNLALQDLVASRSSKKINIAIFDEAFDALDDIGTEHVIEVLQELSNEKSSIFVISHNEHLQSYFSNIITVVKEKGCSRLLGQNEVLDEEEGE